MRKCWQIHFQFSAISDFNMQEQNRSIRYFYSFSPTFTCYFYLCWIALLFLFLLFAYINTIFFCRFLCACHLEKVDMIFFEQCGCEKRPDKYVHIRYTDNNKTQVVGSWWMIHLRKKTFKKTNQPFIRKRMNSVRCIYCACIV